MKGDMTGRVKGHLTCIGPSERKTIGNPLWLWECECGKMVDRTASYVRRVDTCGNGCPFSSALRSRASKGREGKLKHAPGHAGLVRAYGCYQRRGKKVGFDLSLEQFRELTSSDCAYCGAPPSMAYVHQYSASDRAIENNKYIYNSIDRIDSSQGYVWGNCRPACFPCNQMKWDMTEADFKAKITAIYRRHVSGKRGKSAAIPSLAAQTDLPF